MAKSAMRAGVSAANVSLALASKLKPATIGIINALRLLYHKIEMATASFDKFFQRAYSLSAVPLRRQLHVGIDFLQIVVRIVCVQKDVQLVLGRDVHAALALPVDGQRRYSHIENHKSSEQPGEDNAKSPGDLFNPPAEDRKKVFHPEKAQKSPGNGKGQIGASMDVGEGVAVLPGVPNTSSWKRLHRYSKPPPIRALPRKIHRRLRFCSGLRQTAISSAPKPYTGLKGP